MPRCRAGVGAKGQSQPKILSYNERRKFEYAGASGGFIDRNGFPYCRGRLFATVEEDCGQYDDPIPVFWATGAAEIFPEPDYFYRREFLGKDLQGVVGAAVVGYDYIGEFFRGVFNYRREEATQQFCPGPVHPTAFITGTETVARRLDAAVVYWDMRKTSRGRYHIDMKLITYAPNQLPQGAITDRYDPYSCCARGGKSGRIRHPCRVSALTTTLPTVPTPSCRNGKRTPLRGAEIGDCHVSATLADASTGNIPSNGKTL